MVRLSCMKLNQIQNGVIPRKRHQSEHTYTKKGTAMSESNGLTPEEQVKLQLSAIALRLRQQWRREKQRKSIAIQNLLDHLSDDDLFIVYSDYLQEMQLDNIDVQLIRRLIEPE